MKSQPLIDLVRMVTHADPTRREQGAEEVTDWVSSYSESEAAALAIVLSLAAACEEDEGTLEVQLHAILDIASTGYVSTAHLEHLRQVKQEEFSEEIRGYLTAS